MAAGLLTVNPALAIVIALVPVILVGGFMRLAESYRDEDESPSGVWRFVVALLVGGVFAIVGSLLVGDSLTRGLSGYEGQPTYPLIVHGLILPLVEELLKAAPLWWIALRGHMRDPLDLSLMAVVAGVGFAAVETLIALLLALDDPDAFIAAAQIRLAFATPLHAAATLVAVRPVSASRPASLGDRLILGLLASTALHGAWNGSLLLSDLVESPAPALAALLIPLAASGLLIARIRRDILSLGHTNA